MSFQNTFITSGRIDDIAIHNGKKSSVIIEPSGVNAGIIFCLPNGAWLRAHISNALDCNQNTTVLSNGTNQVITVEHIMSAFFAMGIDNALITLCNNSELPILDGSSHGWIQIFETLGIKKQSVRRRIFRVKKPFELVIGRSRYLASPSKGFEMNCKIDFSNSVIQTQQFLYCHTPATYKSDIAPARTFLKNAFHESSLKEIQKRLRGLKFPSTNGEANLIIYDDKRYLTPLRFHNEPVRHKILDFIGDLYLCGGRVLGKFEAIRPGHKANLKLCRAILRNSELDQDE